MKSNLTRSIAASGLGLLLLAPGWALAGTCNIPSTVADDPAIGADGADPGSWSTMTVGTERTFCADSNFLNISSGEGAVTTDEVEGWLQGLGAAGATWIGKAEFSSTGVTFGQNQPLTWVKDSDTTGTWTAAESTEALKYLIVALKFDRKTVEFHDLGSLASGATGKWETDQFCDLSETGGSLVGTCGDSWGLSNANFFLATERFRTNEPPTVPLPAAAWLFGSALVGMVGVGWRRKARA